MPPTPSPKQRAAIEAPPGPTLVVAGPGAGKTFCLIGRIAHLVLHHGVEPSRVLAITFTNRAAEEIASRLEAELGAGAAHITGGTLHALCVQILREHGAEIGIEPGFGIADETYQDLVLQRLGVWRTRRNQLLTHFGQRRLKGRDLTAGEERLLVRYTEFLKRRNLLDFDQLTLETARLFHDHPEIADAVAARWEHVLVDEFQDIDPTQYAIIRALGERHGNVFAVGDDEQSIYAFRGADPSVLRRFAEDFGVSSPIVLDRNRRCSVQIFQAARRLLTANTPLFVDKNIVAERRSEHDVAVRAFPDDAAEAQWIVEDIAADRATSGRGWGSYALLYRRHTTGNLLEGKLLEAGIPCRLAQGRALRDDPAVQFVQAALRVVQQPHDEFLIEALARQVLPDGLLSDVRRRARESDEDFLSAVASLARAKQPRDPDRAHLWRFFYEVENLGSLARRHHDLLPLLEELLSRRVGPYANPLEDNHDELADPAARPDAVALAETLRNVVQGRGRVAVPVHGGVGIAVKGMLLAGGVTEVAYAALEPRTSESSGVAHGPWYEVPPDPLLVFKALQCLHASQLAERLEAFTTFDLETTDVDVTQCEVVEIAAVRVRGGKPVERFHRLVRPSRPISPVASAKSHGYTDADVAAAPPFATVWQEFREFVGGDLLVAHNALEFDVPVLERMVHGLGDLEEVARFNSLDFFDTLPLARDLVSGSAKLGDLARRFGIDPGREHRALHDCESLARVFIELEELKAARTRKIALVNLVDWVAAGLALGGTRPANENEEARILYRVGRVRALGSWSSVLDVYEAEQQALGDPSVPSVEELIRKLGGQRLMARLRRERTAEQRYPETLPRLRAIVAAVRGDTLEQRIQQFLDALALTTSREGAGVQRHRVNLLTLHATKGLEFPCVYVVGVEDEEFLRRTDDGRDPPQSELEEARRLLYVGMTRAEDRLVLTWCGRRNGWSRSGRRFLDEMGLAPQPA